MINDIVQECKKWEDIIRSNEDYTDHYAKLNPDFLQYGMVRDAIIFTTLGPDDYRYDPDTETDLKDFPSTVDSARFNRTLDLLEDVRDDFTYLDEQADHINAVLGFLHWAVGQREEALEALARLEEPTRLAQLTATALAFGMPRIFIPGN